MTTIVETGRDTKHTGCGGRLVSVDGRRLPLRAAALEAEAGGGLARSILRQTYRNDQTEPLEVLYTFPLPAECAVAAYEFRIGARRVTGRIDRRAAARVRYEQALAEGRTAGLVDQERANLFTQRLGNVPPGVEVIVELHVDQKLRWLSEGLWEWRFPTVAAPRYLGEAGRVADADQVSVEVADRDTGIRASLEMVVLDPLTEGGAPRSPSHAIRTDGAARGDAPPAGSVRVRLAEAGASLDRDIVVRWPVTRAESGVALRRARPGADTVLRDGAYGLLTIVPPEGPAQTLPRDLILLIDTSGSMSGRPIETAKQVVKEMIASLVATDRLELIAFSSEPRRWRRDAAEATGETRRQATGWVDALAARGGTEMTRAIEEALQPLRGDAQRQVVLVTDGEVGFEQEVFRAIRDRLPSGSRLHTVGVGSAVNAALLGPAARAGRGVGVIIDLDDETGAGVARLVAATRGPVLIDVVVDGSVVTGMAPRCLPDLLAGAPLLASVRLRPDGGTLRVRGRSGAGTWERSIEVPPTAAGEGAAGITTLFGREAIADLELDRAAGGDATEVDAAIERIGLQFGLATRLTSWIAVSEEPTVDPRRPVKITRIPQELPYGLSAEGLGLRSDQFHFADRMAMAMLPAGLVSGARPARFRFGMFGRHGETSADQAISVPGLLDIRIPETAWHMRFAARWVSGAEPGAQIITFEVVDVGLKWRPEAVVLLIRGSETKVLAEVVVALTTASGTIAPGSRVRLGLRLAGCDPATIVAVIVVSRGRLLRLEP